MKALNSKILTVIGWREWVELPELGVEAIKAKVDTGARSSSIHVFDLHEYEKEGKTWVRYKLHPIQRKSTPTLEVNSEVLEYRSVRSSSGKATRRPVIVTTLNMLGRSFPVELTLASRDKMGFRMLLGREAIRGKFLVDSGRSYLGTKPVRKMKRKTGD